jgi:D-3-phosphoglycerate dehydrogenase
MRFCEIDVSTPELVREGTENADALVVALHPLRNAHIDALAETVRVIGRAGVGLDSIDLVSAQRRGIAVINQPDYATNEVATHAVAMLLAAHRRLLKANVVAHGDWASWRLIGNVMPIEEQTVGVIGGGRIGRAVIKRLQPFAGAIALFDPQLEAAPEGVDLVSDLHELLARSNIVTLHVPLTEDTRDMMAGDTLKLMPEGAIVVNVSRGGLIDEQALVDSIRSGHLAGAALDVMAKEPLDPDSPLLTEDRILLSPHIGWYSESASSRLVRRTVDGLLQYLSGQPLSAGNLAVDRPA